MHNKSGRSRAAPTPTPSPVPSQKGPKSQIQIQKIPPKRPEGIWRRAPAGAPGAPALSAPCPANSQLGSAPSHPAHPENPACWPCTPEKQQENDPVEPAGVRKGRKGVWWEFEEHPPWCGRGRWWEEVEIERSSWRKKRKKNKIQVNDTDTAAGEVATGSTWQRATVSSGVAGTGKSQEREVGCSRGKPGWFPVGFSSSVRNWMC